MGDEVYTYACRLVVKRGTFAKYIVITESYLAKRPFGTSWEEKAGLTAYKSVYEAGKLQESQKIMILGASRGVGTFATQLAKAKGAALIGVASEKTRLRSRCADLIIDYTKKDIRSLAREIFSEG